MTRYLVTSALPYANGPIHFGHVVGAYLPADCYVRTLRMLGEEVCFVCGTDEYGVAITVGAEQAGRPYAEYVGHWRDQIKSLFDRLHIEFDVWSGTSVSPYHEELALEFFRRLRDNGYLVLREEAQLFCQKDEMFLADRYVIGTCPKCGHDGARGDECPSCGSWLDALSLADARCKICGSQPEKRSTEHWYIDLEKLRDEQIGEWFRSKSWKPNVQAFVANMLEQTQSRPITRDLSWGVPLSREEFYGAAAAPAGAEAAQGAGKVLYVWFDAPIGYVSFTREWAEARGTPDAWREFWQSPDTRLVHFIGKDNIPFHCVVFPSMLWGVKQGYVLPWHVPANEFYNLQGRKFSTSEDWTIPLERFFERYDSEAARFYLLSSMPETADSEWRWEEFQGCVNSSLADKIGNLATRVLRFIDKHFEAHIPPLAPEHAEELDRVILGECGEISDPAEAVLEFRFRRAAELLLANASVANVFIDRLAPWALRKSDPERAASVLNTACEWIGWMARWMVPFMPRKAQALWEMIGCTSSVESCAWPGVPRAKEWRQLPAGQALGAIQAPFAKIDDASIAAELSDLRARAGD